MKVSAWSASVPLTPPLIKSLSTAKKTKKKIQMIKKAVAPTIPTDATIPPPVDFPFDRVPLAEHLTPQPSSAQMVEGSGVLMDGKVFMRLIALLEE